jgi:hypothetical protein
VFVLTVILTEIVIILQYELVELLAVATLVESVNTNKTAAMLQGGFAFLHAVRQLSDTMQIRRRFTSSAEPNEDMHASNAKSTRGGALSNPSTSTAFSWTRGRPLDSKLDAPTVSLNGEGGRGAISPVFDSSVNSNGFYASTVLTNPVLEEDGTPYQEMGDADDTR